ncbi:MAG: biosynthetic-type acetolactate synthase large subunit [Candidatus Delongbacteria bacterium]|nr:biosynthetic-type acetolactate synthase large subunit [Candidatus Delongbacteria bacterium]
MKMTGAQALIKSLELEGVTTVFGYPGGAILPVYDALKDSSIHHVLVRHEQAAGHAASGYARITGKTGVCIVTSGPGATNLITGIATAYMDSIPIVAITGQVPAELIGRDVFQEADITGATEPFTKHNYLVKNVKDIPRIVKEAFIIAGTGRPGPVLIDLPKDICFQTLTFQYPDQITLRGYKPTYTGHPNQIKKMIKAIQESKKPMICVGGGAISSNASDEILKLAEAIQSPVATTLMGIGAFPTSHPLFIGMMGHYGRKTANQAISEADLLIALGARMGDRATIKREEFARKAHIIHIDIDPAEIGKNIKADIPIVGDIQRTLKELNKEPLEPKSQEWLKQIRQWQAEERESMVCTEGLNPIEILQTLSDMTDKENTIIVTDVGQHQIWTGLTYHVDCPRTFISSGGLGTMGYGLPAAIGAKMAAPHKNVILVVGDGGFQMSQSELSTLKQENLAVKIILFNNQALGMVRELQQHHCNSRYYQVHITFEPDFITLASAYQIPAQRITKCEEVRQSLINLLESDQPGLLEFQIDPWANVIPCPKEVKR